jgi:hypothetical protein
MEKKTISTKFGRLVSVEAVERISKLIDKNKELVEVAITSCQAYNAYAIGVSICRNFNLENMEYYAAEIRSIIHKSETQY